MLYLDSIEKRIARGVVQRSQKQHTHQRFKNTLLSGKTLRIYNYSFKSKAHTNIIIAQNRLALSLFDSKQFLLFDGIATLPTGHKSTEDNVFIEAIAEESEWSNSQLTDSSTYINDSGNSDSDNRGSEQSPVREFQIPDWGFLQESYTEEELKEESAASNLRDPPPIRNPFILTETSISSEKIRKKGENLIIVDQSKPSSLKCRLNCLVSGITAVFL